MDADKKTKVEEYINNNEQTQWFWKIAETVAELAWVEKETKEWFLSKWLKNDENLLSYAELTMKTEKLNFWESIKRKLLEVKLSITCPYFADFKSFLEDLKQWNTVSTNGNIETSNYSTTHTNSSTTETTYESVEIWNHTFCWISLNNIKSEPFQKNSKTWVTWCSKTARFNWYNFGLNLPSWNAYDAWRNPWNDSIKTIPEDKKNRRPERWWKWIELSKFKSITKWNYADIYVESKSSYGHRAAAFRDDSWQWYVLDPYSRVNWRLDNSPKRLEDYSKARKIVKAHIYESKWYKEGNSDSHQDEWKWYEWGTK